MHNIGNKIRWRIALIFIIWAFYYEFFSNNVKISDTEYIEGYEIINSDIPKIIPEDTIVKKSIPIVGKYKKYMPKEYEVYVKYQYFPYDHYLSRLKELGWKSIGSETLVSEEEFRREFGREKIKITQLCKRGLLLTIDQELPHWVEDFRAVLVRVQIFKRGDGPCW